MNLDSIMKLCKMISNAYSLVAIYVDVDGNLLYSSNLLEENHRKQYLDNTKHLIEHCMNTKEIKISINEISITWIGIPVIIGDIVIRFLIIGPYFSNRLEEKYFMDTVNKMNLSEDAEREFIKHCSSIPYYPYKEYVKLIKFAFYYIYDQELIESKLGVIDGTDWAGPSEDDNETINGSSEVEFHGTYLFERYLIECIRSGDVNKLSNLFKSEIPGKPGILSVNNELRHLKNLLIAGIVLASRAAMEGGLNSEIAYSISDIYIRQVESMNTFSPEFANKIFFDYAGRVRELNKVKAYSPYINQCCEYIKSHVYESISVGNIAEYLGISLEYLSRIFKQETGLTIVGYLKKVKVREAKFLLKYTDNSLVDVSEKLTFSSQSHFNSVFKSEMSVTPKQYRDKVKVTS